MSFARSVILHHRRANGEHCDLVIEQGDVLAAWIGDQRPAYLGYEGPIGGGRGEVSRIEEGVCEVPEAGQSWWRRRLRGCRIVGALELSADQARGGRLPPFAEES